MAPPATPARPAAVAAPQSGGVLTRTWAILAPTRLLLPPVASKAPGGYAAAAVLSSGMNPRLLRPRDVRLSCTSISRERRKARHTPLYALPETAISIVVAAVTVGASAILFRRMTEASSKSDGFTKSCEDCGGSGICTECNGEGFILKPLPEEKAKIARMTAKNMATRYTAGLPKKWSYCYKCSSSRSCRTCGGSGQILA